jgi:hypothetical protein
MVERSFLRALACSAVTALLVVAAGCLSDSDEDEDDGPGPPRVDPVRRTISNLEAVWRHRLYREYEMVLHDRFEFYPLERDAKDFPWMTGPSWDKSEELSIAQHMFDPNFTGDERAVDEIEIALTELSRRELTPDHFEVTCSQKGRVLTTAEDGWSFDTRMVIEIVADPDEPGLFLVIKQTEIPRT